MRTPRCGSRALLVGLAFVGLALVGRLPAAANPEDSFKQGIEAADLKRWEEAARHLREAIAEDPQESEKRVLLSGVFTRPYLPHFYLGVALYNAGHNHCEEALRAWEISLAQAVVTRLKRQHQELQKARDTCNGLLLPAAIEAAARELEHATETAGRLTDTPALAAASAAGRERLAAARDRFESGKSASRLGDLRHAENEARAAAEQLAEVLQQVSQAATGRLEAAGLAARQAIAEATGAQQALAALLRDPGRATVWRRHPEVETPAAAVELLRSARAKSGDGANLGDLEAAGVDAAAAKVAFDAARTQAERIFADDLEAQDRRPTAMVSPADPGSTPVDARTLPPPPNAEPRQRTADTRDPATATEVRRLTQSAERLLGLVGSGDTSSRLLDVQRSRLTSLILAAREEGGVEGLRRRLADSMAALQLLSGAEAYLGGAPRRAVEILTLADLADERLAAQAHLFLAASRFALYRLGGEGDALLLAQVTASVARCRELAPALVADPRTFPPPFRDLFAQKR